MLFAGSSHMNLINLAAIVANLLGQSGCVGVVTLFKGKLPDGYDRVSLIKLLTWGDSVIILFVLIILPIPMFQRLNDFI